MEKETSSIIKNKTSPPLSITNNIKESVGHLLKDRLSSDNSNATVRGLSKNHANESLKDANSTAHTDTSSFSTSNLITKLTHKQAEMREHINNCKVQPMDDTTTGNSSLPSISNSTSAMKPSLVNNTNNLDQQKQRLNQLIEQIANQDIKLNRLKALRKLAKEQASINVELNQELKAVNDIMLKKDSELKQAFNRVDNLNRQLSNYRRTRNYRNSANVSLTKQQLLQQRTNDHHIQSSDITDSKELHEQQPKSSPEPKISDLEVRGESKADLGSRRVSFDPLALLLDASLVGELDLVKKTVKQVPCLSASHDDCVTALHNAAIAGHYDVAKFLIEAGCDINVQSSDGWSPLHCAANSNNLPLVRLLILNGAAIFVTTTKDQLTPALKCELTEPGYEECYNYLVGVQNNLGVMNNGVVYALYDYDAQEEDELTFRMGDELMIIRRDDSAEQEWWWAQKRTQQSSDTVIDIKEGYVPRNLVGLYPRNKAFRKKASSAISNRDVHMITDD